MGIPKEHPLFGHLIKVGSLDDVVQAALAFDLGIDAGVFSPIISKEE
jgi:hypothetical protein